jgi:hypothetical protein
MHAILVGLQVVHEHGFADADGAADSMDGQVARPAELAGGVEGDVQALGHLLHRQHAGDVGLEPDRQEQPG